MKIYRPNDNNQNESEKNLLLSLIYNNLPLKDKYSKLIEAYSEIKLTPGGINAILESLIDELGGTIRFPRVGDNNERFDAIIEFEEYICLTEIEIPSTTILDAPRNLLDNYAVAISRHNIKYKPIVLLVICWDVPNKRTDYLNVVTDINSILNLKIKTISIPALALHYWSKTPIDLKADYYLDADNQKMINTINILDSLNLPENLSLGYLEPIK